MAEIEDVRSGLRDALAAIDGLEATDSPLDALEPPYAVVGEITVEYDKTFGRGGLDQLEAKVRVYASRTDVAEGTKLLDGYMSKTGPSSVKAALETDRTLDGRAETLRAEKADAYGAYEVAGSTYLGVEFTVRLWVKGDTTQ